MLFARTIQTLIAALCGVCLFVVPAMEGVAAEWFVDNRVGDDGFDGKSELPLGGRQGPFLSINKALTKVHAADSIHIANQGMPYYEALSLSGARCSGVGMQTFRILGHGAILSGARAIPPNTWKETSVVNLWQFTPRRKGWYQLINGPLALPEVPLPRNATALPEVPAGHWCAWRGSIYYRSHPEYRQTPDDLPLGYAVEQTGITLIDVRNVEIRDLTVRHFRGDGINAHDRSTQVFLENVKLLENGRAGLAVGGSSLVGLTNSECRGNRIAQIINTEAGQTELLHSQLGDKPGAPLQIDGGHVLIDGVEVEVVEDEGGRKD